MKGMENISSKVSYAGMKHRDPENNVLHNNPQGKDQSTQPRLNIKDQINENNEDDDMLVGGNYSPATNNVMQQGINLEGYGIENQMNQMSAGQNSQQ